LLLSPLLHLLQAVQENGRTQVGQLRRYFEHPVDRQLATKGSDLDRWQRPRHSRRTETWRWVERWTLDWPWQSPRSARLDCRWRAATPLSSSLDARVSSNLQRERTTLRDVVKLHSSVTDPGSKARNQEHYQNP
ncbi:unnamed protein product, partial [Heterotrigona itama]